MIEHRRTPAEYRARCPGCRWWGLWRKRAVVADYDLTTHNATHTQGARK